MRKLGRDLHLLLLHLHTGQWAAEKAEQKRSAAAPSAGQVLNSVIDAWCGTHKCSYTC